MANKFLSGINVTGTTTLNTVANAGTDTDKFLVLDASGNVDFRTGDELYADLGIGSLPAGFTSTVKHAVKAGVALTKGQAVYVTGADGTNMIVGKASNASEATSSKTMGLIETALSINGIGNVITEGLLAGLDTTGATNAGDPVWLGTDGNLIYGLLNKPYAPAHLVFIGIVTRINANNGEIFVKVQNGFELNEIHDVDLKTTTPINGHILGYNGTLWVNKTIAGWLGYTPSNDTNVVHLAGTETITGAKTFSLAISGHEGIAFLNGVMPPITSSYYSGIGGNSNGISIVTRPVSTNYTNNLYFPSASNSYTFPNATGTIALTSNLSSYVPTSRTLTINGVAYDLSADRSWTIEAGGSSASTRTIQKFTSTSSQTTFTITGGYTVGMVDVWVNGVKLDNAVDFTASNGTTVVLTDALTASQIVEVYKYGSQFIVNNGLRQKTLFTATAAQTTFTVAYSVGLVDVFYNGSKLDDSEFTATNGTSIVLGTACAVNDKVEVIAFSYNVNGFTGIGGSGTTNNLPKFTAAGTIGDSAITDNGTTVTLVSRALAGTSATFTGSGAFGSAAMSTARLTITDGTSIAAYWKATNTNAATRDWSIITNNNNFGDFAIRQGNSQGADATSGTDRLFISSGGLVGIGYSNPQLFLDSSGYGNLVVGNGSGAKGITIFGGTTGQSGLMFADATSGSGAYTGYILYSHSTDQMELATGGGTPRLTIASTGAATFSSSLSVPTATISSSITSPMFRATPNGTFRVNTDGDAILGYMLRSGWWKGNAENNLAFATDGAYGISFFTNGSASERMFISTAGNVGIGTNGPSERLHINTTAGDTTLLIQAISSNYSQIFLGRAASGSPSYAGYVQYYHVNDSLTFGTNAQPRITITSNGSVCINATSPGSNSPYLYNYNSDGSRFNAAFEVSVATPGFTSVAFRNPNGLVGSIAINTSTVTYGGTSDYRLKEDLKEFNGLDKVCAIKVYDFKWKASEERNEGVLAHELMSVIPYAVNGEKDDIYEDGTIKSQMVDYSKIVPVLIKAIQELKAEIEQLKQK